MAPENDYTIGRHEALIQQLVDGQKQMAADVASIKATLSEHRGERRVVAGMWGIAGGTIVAGLLAALKGLTGLHS